MVHYLRKNATLFVTALLAMIGLVTLSYLTALDFCITMEEQYDTTMNQEVIRELETSISYGKALEQYYGLSDVLARSKSLLRESCILMIQDPDGRVLAVSTPENTISVDRTQYGELRQEIMNPDGTSAGTFLTFYSLQNIRTDLRNDAAVSILGSLLLFALILLVCLAARGRFKRDSRKLIHIIVCGVLIQGLFLGVLYVPRFREETVRDVKGIAYYLENAVNSLGEKGISVEEIHDFQDVLQEKVDSYEWIDSIEIVNPDFVTADENSLLIPLFNSRQNLVFYFHISSRYIRQTVTQMFLTFIATIFIAVVFMMEALPISDLAAFRKTGQFNTCCHAQYDRIAATIRYMSFLSNTFGYLCLSFSALQIKAWNQGCLGLSPAIAAALSISLCTLSESGGLILLPMLTLKPRKLSISTSLLLLVSNLACFFTHSTGIMLLMRFLAGAASAGYRQMVNTMISQGYEQEDEKAANLTGNNAGVIGGILCGMGLGSTIAGVFGYGATFLAAAVGAAMYLSFTWYFIPWNLFSESVGRAAKPGNLLRTLASLSVWRSILLFIAPQYFLLMVIIVWIPGKIQAMSMPPVTLTYANLLNGIFGLYLGSSMRNVLRRHFGPLRSITLMFALGAVSIVFLNLPFFPVAMVLLAAALTGMVDGVGTPLSAELFLRSPALSRIGESASLMLYSILGSVVMSVSPVLLELCAGNLIWGGCAFVCLLLICVLLTLTSPVQNSVG